MTDYVVRAMAADGMIRAFAAITTNMVSTARQLHGLSPVACAALGRTMTTAAIMSKEVLKGEKDTLTIQIKGDGPLGGIVVVSDSDANVKGYVYNPLVYLPLNESGKLDVADAIGRNGYMNVIKDLGLKEPYIGYVDLVSGEVAEDIAYYFAFSEQVPTVVALGVLVDKDESIITAGGFMIQLMPDAQEEIIDYLEKKIASISSITQLLSEGKTPEEVLEIILGEKDLKILEKAPCNYLCTCSRERMQRNLLSLGREELLKLAHEQDNAELQCHFCNMKYNFTRDDVLNLLGSES